jgi:hypothetical protein
MLLQRLESPPFIHLHSFAGQIARGWRIIFRAGLARSRSDEDDEGHPETPQKPTGILKTFTPNQVKMEGHTAGKTFNMVALDTVSGKLNMWTRSSLDRPPCMDGPVIVKRHERIMVDFEARGLTAMSGSGVATKNYDDTFRVPGLTASLLEGWRPPGSIGTIPPGGPSGEDNYADDVFDALYFEATMVPSSSTIILEQAEEEVRKAVARLKAVEEEAGTAGKPLEEFERK